MTLEGEYVMKIKHAELIRNYLHQTTIGPLELMVDYDYETEYSDLTRTGVCHYVDVQAIYMGDYEISDLLSDEVHDRIYEEILHEIS
jgi:hypothetical protein